MILIEFKASEQLKVFFNIIFHGSQELMDEKSLKCDFLYKIASNAGVIFLVPEGQNAL